MKIDDLIEILKHHNVSEKVIEAFRVIKREWFVPEGYKDYAYYDEVIPLLDDVTISQPSVVAIMLDALELREGLKVLEIGTGSGFSTALLSCLVGEEGRVISIEINEKAYEYAKQRLEELVNRKIIYKNFTLILGNGYYGYEREKHYDRIICHAAVKELPKPWLDQIENGIIVSPIGDPYGWYQKLEKVIIKNRKIEKRIPLLDVVFVPLKI